MNRLFSCAPEPSPVWIPHCFYGDKLYRESFRDKRKLANPRPLRDFGLSHCQSWEGPDIAVSAVIVLVDADAVCLDNSPPLKGELRGAMMA